jgi:hypothetical protein
MLSSGVLHARVRFHPDAVLVVHAAAVTHVLSTAGEIIIASERIRLSWFNGGWMLASLLFTCAWWIGLWDLHAMKTWSVGWIALNFSMAAGIYLQARLDSPRIPEKGEIDLQEFHFEEGRKYLVAYAILSWITVAVNALLGEVPASCSGQRKTSSSFPWLWPQRWPRSS